MKGKGPCRDLERERVWRAVMDRQRESGLSVRGFCRREVISEASFYAWRRELLRRDGESSSVRRADRESGVRPAASRSARVVKILSCAGSSLANRVLKEQTIEDSDDRG